MSRSSPGLRYTLRNFAPPGFVLVVGLIFRLSDLTRNGFGNQYYSAGVLSMTQSLHNFFFNAFDPAGILAVDKPPVALWIQVISVKLFGFHSLSLLLPQVLEGLAAIILVWHLVQRRHGAMPGFIAGLLMAITPISVAVDRSSNVDSCLVMVLLLAAWALIVAIEQASAVLLLLSLALVGVAFNVKMMAAFVVLPAFVLSWWLGTRLPPRRRFLALMAAGAVCLLVSLAWVGTVELTPAAQRPYVDSSPVNSMLDLVVDHNALQRFVPRAWRRMQQAGTQPDTLWHQVVDGPTHRVPAGPLRLFNPELASQVAWLLPLALIGGLSVLVGVGFAMPLAAPAPEVVLWLGWLLTYAVVYSAADGIFSPYYLVTLAPPLAALAAVGGWSLWLRYRTGQRWPLTAALVVTAAWQIWLIQPVNPIEASDAVRPALVVVAACAIAIAGFGSLLRPARSATAAAVALATLAVPPWVWSQKTAFELTQGSRPVAALEPPVLSDPPPRQTWAQMPHGQIPQVQISQELVAFLQARAGGMPYLAAVSNARLAAPLIIATGAPVIALGGFQGSIPVMTLPTLEALVSSGQLRYVLLEDTGQFARRQAGGQQGWRSTLPRHDIADWVRMRGVAVDPAQWQNARRQNAEAVPRQPGQLRLYDLNPTEGATSSLLAPTPPANTD